MAEDPRDGDPAAAGGRGPLRRRAALSFFALERSIVAVLVMVVLVGMGEKLAERFLPLYLVALGGGALSVGLLNGLDNLLSALYSLLGGHVASRLGVKRALLLFNLAAVAGFAMVVAVPSWPAVLAGSVLFLSWTAISLPATMELVARVLPPGKRVMGVSMHSMVRRIPMALGPLVGGVLIDRLGVEAGVRTAFAVAIVFAVAAAALQQRWMAVDPPRAPDLAGTAPRPGLLRSMPPALRRLLAADILVRFCEQIPYAFVVLWCLNEIDGPVTATQFGILTTVEMATALAIYVPVAWLADRGGKKPFVVATFGFFTLFPLALYFSRSFWPLVAVFVLRGLKEFGEPTRKALILELAPDERKAATFGLYYLLRDVVVSVAAFGGALLWRIDPAVNLFTACGCGLVGTLWFAWRGQDESGRR
ncbi:MAG: MFS transporter [Acidobacteriota bacterium]|nr:MFS transporter [Acidobacteriota bacterium]